MKKLFTRFFVFLGAIFFIILSAGAYLWYTDKEVLITHATVCFLSEVASGVVGTQGTPSGGTGDKNPMLTPEQETLLEEHGIDPASVPSSITPEMEACFEKTLGEDRVNEIKAGAEPTATELFTARSCIE